MEIAKVINTNANQFPLLGRCLRAPENLRRKSGSNNAPAAPGSVSVNTTIIW